MASITIGWSSSEACGVTLGADGGNVNAGQWEVRCRVVKSRVQPVIRVMAHGAINRVLLGFVIFRSVILNLVTGDAIRWGIEYRSLMTGGALGNSRVSAGQFKASRSMVKGRWFPSGWGVASFALNGYSGSRMVRIYGSGIVRSVASITISWCSGEACGVALGTFSCNMNADKWKIGRRVVKQRI